MMAEEEALSISQLAKEYDIPGGMLRKALREGSLTGHKKGRRWFVYRRDMPDSVRLWVVAQRTRTPKNEYNCARCGTAMGTELWVVTQMTRREGTAGRYTIQGTTRYCSKFCTTGASVAPQRRGLFGWFHA